MSISRIQAFPGSYRDSLLLLNATRAMQDSNDVSWASAAMATPAVVADLTGRGFSPDALAGADANALVLAVCAAGDPAASEALDRGRALLFAEASRPDGEAAAGPIPVRSARRPGCCPRRTWRSCRCRARTPRSRPIPP